MPQLDIYIIWDIIFYVLIVWLYIYKLNISTIIIILNIILRVRKIKMQGDKKYSYFLLKEILINMKLKIYEYSFSNKYNILKKKIIFLY